MSSELLRKYIDLFEEQKPYRVDVTGYNIPPPPYAVFIGDSIAFGLSSTMMTNTRADAAVGLSSNAIANRVARNEKVQRAEWAIISAGTNDFATDQGNPTALESNLALIRTGLKVRQFAVDDTDRRNRSRIGTGYVWLGPYNEQANAVVKKFADSKGDTFIDLRTFPPDRLGIHPARYSDVMISIRKQTKLGPTDPNYDHSWNYGSEKPQGSPALLPDSERDPAPATGTKPPAGGGGAPPVAGTQTTTKAPAPAPGNADPVEKTEPPKDIKQYKDKVKKLKIDFQTKFDRSLPITSEERTRAEQKNLYDRWLKKEPGIYIPINPDNHPGREIFHNTAIDVSPALSRDEEAWMKEQGWVRTIPEKDPPHYEYKGKWDETPAPAPTPAVTPNQEKPVTPLIKPEDLDRLGDILKKLPKKESHDKLSMLKNINQRSPQEQMQLWQAVVIAEAPAREPTFNPDAFDPPPDLDPNPATPSQPKARIIPDGAKFAVVSPAGQRFGGFDSQRQAWEWIAEPKNYRMLYPNSTNWIGGTPPAPSGRKPLSNWDRIMKTPVGKFTKAFTAAAALGGTAYSVYDRNRAIDLSGLSPDDQRFFNSIMPALKTFYKDPEKYAKDYKDSPEQIKKLKNYIIQLKQRPGGNNVFPPSDVWDAWMKTQPNTQ